MAMLRSGDLIPLRQPRPFLHCVPALGIEYLDPTSPGSPKVLIHLKKLNETAPSFGIILHNQTQKTIWTVMTNFKFRAKARQPPHEWVAKTQCGQFSTDQEILPGQARQLAFRFVVGKCSAKEVREYQLKEEATLRGEKPARMPRTRMLKKDEELQYQFEIHSWTEFPWPDKLLQPEEVQQVTGLVVIPAGIPSDYCVHHCVHSFTS